MDHQLEYPFYYGNNNMLTMQYMTGLPNSSGYMRLVTELKDRKGLKGYSAFFFNLKRFEKVNRKYGQDRSDEIIRAYASTLKSFVLHDEIVGHFGGDNFMALIHQERRGLFVSFLRYTPIKMSWMESDIVLSATIGIWDINDDKNIDVGSVVNRPSMAMNEAKYVTHEDVAVASEEMVKQAGQRAMVIEHFDEAIENTEFEVFYQPKVDSRTKTLVGAEGLVRWNHNDEMISPGVFIPPLEENGQILMLDYYVLERACNDIAGWVKHGYDPVTVSVNFSRKDLEGFDLAEHIDRIIKKSGIDKKLIEVEVTETTDKEEHGALANFINDLSKRGIATAIDDFGTGYSSLSTLREFSASTLKIDRSFVNIDDFSWKDEVILKDIINMAKDLGMNIITEGVEREDQLKFVNQAGCFVIQGFFYDRPLPREEFEKRLLNKNY